MSPACGCKSIGHVTKKIFSTLQQDAQTTYDRGIECVKLVSIHHVSGTIIHEAVMIPPSEAVVRNPGIPSYGCAQAPKHPELQEGDRVDLCPSTLSIT